VISINYNKATYFICHFHSFNSLAINQKKFNEERQKLSPILCDIGAMENQTTFTSKWSDETILDLIRNLRNDLIKDFLDERFLKEYLANTYGIRDISNVKIEFIKKELKSLLIAPVNVTHYKPVIEKIRSSDTASLSEGNEQLFYAEIETILKAYMY
jgi:hypothetical protein